ncbi:hypothetical protein [Bradyrhizobium ottawaense]
MADEQNAFPFSLKDLTSKIATKGDLATVLIAAPVGYGLDLALSLTGIISPGTFGLLAASSALGTKQLIQSGIERRRNVPALPPPPPISVKAKAENAIRLLNSKGYDLESKRVQNALELYENSLLDDAGLQQRIDDTIKRFQNSDSPSVGPSKE